KEGAMHVGRLAPEERVLAAVGERERDAAPTREERCRLLDARAHERVGVLEPGDADLELLERAERDRTESRHEGAHQLEAAGDARRERADVVVAGREREAALRRHEVERRLEPGDAAPGRRNADRAARIAAERELDLPGGDRGRRAAARPAGEASRRARVRHRAEVWVLRADPVGELVQVRL